MKIGQRVKAVTRTPYWNKGWQSKFIYYQDQGGRKICSSDNKGGEYNMRPKYSSIQDSIIEQQIITKRMLMIEQDIKNIDFPRALYDIDNMGKALIRLFIFPCYNTKNEKSEFTPSEYRKLIALLRVVFQLGKTKFKRSFREKEGTFLLRADKNYKDSNGKFKFIILIEKTVQTKCKIIKKRKMMTVYETNCK